MSLSLIANNSKVLNYDWNNFEIPISFTTCPTFLMNMDAQFWAYLWQWLVICSFNHPVSFCIVTDVANVARLIPIAYKRWIDFWQMNGYQDFIHEVHTKIVYQWELLLVLQSLYQFSAPLIFDSLFSSFNYKNCFDKNYQYCIKETVNMIYCNLTNGEILHLQSECEGARKPVSYELMQVSMNFRSS